MFDFLFEIGSSVPWIYRSWIYIFSATYRSGMKQLWQKKGRIYRLFDILLSVTFMILEVVLFYWLLK